MLSRSRLLALVLAALVVSLLTAVGVAIAALPSGGTFTDDNGNIHEGNIEAIAAVGITKGCNPPANDWYCPGNPLTRGQMAAFLRRALELPSSNVDYFGDDDESVFEGDINALAMAGITRGCNPPASDRFCPDGYITREQMAAFLRRAFEYPAASIDYFSDDEASIFESDINAIAEAKVTLGCNPPSNTRYCPNDLVKRDQMASFFARALDLAPIHPPPPTSSTTTSSTTSSTTTTTTTTLPPTYVSSTTLFPPDYPPPPCDYESGFCVAKEVRANTADPGELKASCDLGDLAFDGWIQTLLRVTEHGVTTTTESRSAQVAPDDYFGSPSVPNSYSNTTAVDAIQQWEWWGPLTDPWTVETTTEHTLFVTCLRQ